jgi:hypothetical protein
MIVSFRTDRLEYGPEGISMVLVRDARHTYMTAARSPLPLVGLRGSPSNTGPGDASHTFVVWLDGIPKMDAARPGWEDA